MFTATNGFERWVACYHAGDRMIRWTGSHTWHDDEEASLSVPDDSASVLAVIGPGYDGETAWFITPIKTATQLKNARRMLKWFQIEDDINGAAGSEARAIVDAERLAQAQREQALRKAQAQREENLRQHREMRAASRRATIAHNKAQAAAARAREAATWCNPMHGAFDVR